MDTLIQFHASFVLYLQDEVLEKHVPTNVKQCGKGTKRYTDKKTKAVNTEDMT